MKNLLYACLLFIIAAGDLSAQGQTYSDTSFPFADYWPVLLLPIFGIIWYRWWKAKKRR